MLELRHISKRFGDREILSDISLNINQGEIVSILGPSGCGKTTLLNLILGLTDLTEGQLIYDGEDLSHVSMKDRGFNIVFQDFALFPNLNARENILYGLRNNPNASTKQEVEDLIDLLGLRKHLEQRIDDLSGGQKQRVAIARTLVLKPRLLLLDEPLSAIDGYMRWQLELTLSDIIRNFGGMYLMVTHHMGEAYRNCGTICTIDNGKTQGTSKREDFINSPSSVGAARISGCKNIFAFERTENDGEIFVPELNINLSISGNLDGRSHIAFRDSAVDFDCRENRMECMIERVIDDAFSTIIMLRPLNGKDALLRAEIKKDRAAGFCAGKKVTVGVRAEDIMPLE